MLATLLLAATLLAQGGQKPSTPVEPLTLTGCVSEKPQRGDYTFTDADGMKTRMEYVASFNVPTATVAGSQQTDAIRLKIVDRYTAEGELSYQGKPVGRTRRVVSQDGMTMTITLDRTAPATVHNVFVYRRIP